VNGELGAGMNGQLDGRIRSCSVGKAWSEGTGTSLVYGVGQEGGAYLAWVIESTLFIRGNYGIRNAPKCIFQSKLEQDNTITFQRSFLSHSAFKSLQKMPCPTG